MRKLWAKQNGKQGNFVQVEKFALRKFSRMREIRTVREIAPALLASFTSFLHKIKLN